MPNLQSVYGSDHTHENDDNRVVGCPACTERAKCENLARDINNLMTDIRIESDLGRDTSEQYKRLAQLTEEKQHKC